MAALQITCEECGKPFEAKTRRAKFCHVNCRVRANRRPGKVGKAKAAQSASGAPTGGQVVTLPTASGPDAGSEQPEGLLAAQVRTSLTEYEALETFAGAAAVRVAQQIDRGEDSGSAVATMTKELSRLMAEARAEAAPKKRDGADDVMSRAAEKILRLVQ